MITCSEVLTHARLNSERFMLEMVDHGIKVMFFRLPAFVYGNNGSHFIPAAIQNAKQHKAAYYIGKCERETVWCAGGHMLT